jgi:hypothetical protein
MTASKPAILCSIDVMTYENITLPPPICGSVILILYRTKAFTIYWQGDIGLFSFFFIMVF